MKFSVSFFRHLCAVWLLFIHWNVRTFGLFSPFSLTDNKPAIQKSKCIIGWFIHYSYDVQNLVKIVRKTILCDSEMEMNPKKKSNKCKRLTLRICLFASRNDKIQSKFRNEIEKMTHKQKYGIQNPEKSKNPITVTCRIQIQLLNFSCQIWKKKRNKTIYLQFTPNAMHKMKWSRRPNCDRHISQEKTTLIAKIESIAI